MYRILSHHTAAQADAIRVLNAARLACSQIAYDYGNSYVNGSREQRVAQAAHANALALKAIAF